MYKVIIFIIFLTSNSVYADYELLRKQQNSCGDFSNYRQIYGCNLKLYEKADSLMNKEYQELVTYLSGENKDNLINAQRKWITFRDADCLFSDPRNDEHIIASANKSACLADRTLDRLKQIEWYNRGWNKGCNGCPW